MELGVSKVFYSLTEMSTLNHSYPPGSDAQPSSRPISPTPSEIEILEKPGFIRRPRLSEWRKYLKKRYLLNWFLFLFLVTTIVLTLALHDQVVDWLRPVGNKLKSLPAGWLIPVAILIVQSFPPLFGHEFIAIACGVIWGQGIGFGIVAFGTLLGEVANYVFFRYFCTTRSKKLERSNAKFGLLSHVIREGGILLIIMVRLSAIPAHFTTIVFATVGTNFFVFLLACVLALPRTFAVTYIGVAAAQNDEKSPAQKAGTALVIIGTIVLTLLAMHYVNRKVDKAKADFIRARQQARQQESLVLDDAEHTVDSPQPVLPSTPLLSRTVDNVQDSNV